MTAGLIVLVVIALLIIYVIGIYNKLITLRNRFRNAFSQIDVQLKRRYDLIPNLIETAKGYMAHERETLEAVIHARNQATKGLESIKADPSNTTAMKDFASAEASLAGAMSKFNLVVEAYPDLKANENMMQLSEELTATENRVAFARQAFNDAVTAYNDYKQSFPPVIFAGTFGHSQNATLLEFEDREAFQEAPKVTF